MIDNLPEIGKRVINSKPVSLAISAALLFTGIGATPSPMYRLTSSDHPDHVYTLSSNERDSAQSVYRYIYEGVAFSVYNQQENGSLPIHRLVSSSGHHLMTWSEEEKTNAVAHFGLTYEGVVGYAPSGTEAGVMPLYRLHAGAGDYFYTMSVAERDNAVITYGYTAEGLAGYVFSADFIPVPTPTSTSTRTPTPIPENCPESIGGGSYTRRACFTDNSGTRRLWGLTFNGAANSGAIDNWNLTNSTYTNQKLPNRALYPQGTVQIDIQSLVVDTSLNKTYLLTGIASQGDPNIRIVKAEYFDLNLAITDPTNYSTHHLFVDGLPQGGTAGSRSTIAEIVDSNGKRVQANIMDSVNTAENGSYDSRLNTSGIPGTWSKVLTSSINSEAKITITPTRTATPKPTTTISFPNLVTGRRESFTVTPTPRGTVAIS